MLFLAVILMLGWVALYLVFQVAGWVVHVLLILAIAMFLIRVLRGERMDQLAR